MREDADPINDMWVEMGLLRSAIGQVSGVLMAIQRPMSPKNSPMKQHSLSVLNSLQTAQTNNFPLP